LLAPPAAAPSYDLPQGSSTALVYDGDASDGNLAKTTGKTEEVLPAIINMYKK
jgi:hypothetical protein